MSVMQSISSFQWPWQYDFSPFFTLQTNLDTRSKQIEAWCDLVLAYYRHIRAYTMDINEAQSSPLFNNTKINSILIVMYCNTHVLVATHIFFNFFRKIVNRNN